MVLTVTGRHVEVTTPLKTYAEQKAGKLTKYYDRILGIDVIVETAKTSTSVEMRVSVEHQSPFIVHHSNGDAYACIDGCVDKLERQLTELKDMIRNRKHTVTDGKRQM